PSPPHPSPLSLHDALPICLGGALLDVVEHLRERAEVRHRVAQLTVHEAAGVDVAVVKPRQDGLAAGVDDAGLLALELQHVGARTDRKSTRLNSSHLGISYA